MTTETEYHHRISKYTWKDLLNLWKQIQAETTPGWSPGKALEYLILRAFQLEGADVRWPYIVKLDEDSNEFEQLDGAIYTQGLACLIECKDQRHQVNVEPVAKLRHQLLRRPSTTVGIIFSRSGFTKATSWSAKFTAPQTILLWEGNEIDLALQNKWMCKGLLAKYRACVEEGLPDYRIKLGV